MSLQRNSIFKFYSIPLQDIEKTIFPLRGFNSLILNINAIYKKQIFPLSPPPRIITLDGRLGEGIKHGFDHDPNRKIIADVKIRRSFVSAKMSRWLCRDSSKLGSCENTGYKLNRKVC